MNIFCFCFALWFLRSVTMKRAVWEPERFKLPENFMYGVSTSAYQVEGAWNVDGKGESVWDRYLHEHPEQFAHGANGDSACESYNNYMRDVEMLREIGVDYYRFSISWSRVLPNGFVTNINRKGLEYYQNLTEELRKYDIEPMATMYHNDLPQAIEDLGGWVNPNIVQWFEEYARLLFANLPKVKFWITINEPSRCFEMYGGGKIPPRINDKGVSDYKCVKNMLMAHARAYRVFEHEYRDKNYSNGVVGMSLALDWGEPINKEMDHAARIYREFTIDLYLHPLLSKNGGFPSLVKEIVDHNSKQEGLETSRLPEFCKDEVELLLKAVDFIGINYYTAFFVDNFKPGETIVYNHIPLDMNLKLLQSASWPESKTYMKRSNPYAFGHLCVYLNKKYNNPPLIVTEHGWSTSAGCNDTDRMLNIFNFLKSIAFALIEGSDLRGYTIWSLMDTIEWTAGTTERFGLYEVDFDSPTKTRTPRLSAHYFRNLIETHMIVENFTVPNKYVSLHISPLKAAIKKHLDEGITNLSASTQAESVMQHESSEL